MAYNNSNTKARTTQARVLFTTSEYEKSHAKQPRGYGSWAFCNVDAWSRNDYLDFVFFYKGTFTEAKRDAARDFAASGVRYVMVCP
jgi:hypothetical protein